jgi:two-component system, NtrC family, sensor histidine kinase HupT/HoxJ
MLKYDFSFVLLHISALFILILFLFIIRIKKKEQIHYVFAFNIALIFIWCLGHILEVYTTIYYGYTVMFYVYLYYFGLCFLPVSLLYTGLIFVKTKLRFSFKYILLFVFPVADYFILITNKFHHLFFIKYSIFNNIAEYGPYFNLHTIVSYAYIIIAIYYLLHFSIKNSGFFSNQSLLIMTGVIVPFLFNIMVTFSIIILPVYYTPISFTFAIACFSFAIFKFKFLNIVPIALQRIVDLISDNYVIVNKNYEIIDYNKTFIETFRNVIKINRKDDFFEIIDKKITMEMDKKRLFESNQMAVENRTTTKYEDHFKGNDFDMYFSVEITPILSDDTYLGSIILFKDVTQSKKDLEIIRRNSAILMEQERLASLGQLIGGIAHNLRTPIMSISGGLEAITELASEYETSIGDKDVTPEDHREIAKEIKEWVSKIKPHCGYMSDVISAVKDQAVSVSNTSNNNFTLGELLKRVEILMKHELKMYHCKINITSDVGMYTEFKGEATSLVQVFNNIIVNAIYSYREQSGEIDLKVVEKNGNIEFSFRDYGSGIPEEVQKKLFKEMLTTKGKFGTGLGLYMSYSTVRGRFNGDLWFESQLGKGSTFYISIPCLRSEKNTEETDESNDSGAPAT